MDNYEQKYKEALERAKQIHLQHKAQCFDVMAEVFPELKESEDEKIREKIIIALHRDEYMNEDEINECVAWLEKQGKQNSVEIDGDDVEIIEEWETIIKEKRSEWQLSDWFVDATSLLVQKIKSTNKKYLNIGKCKSMFNACVNVLRNVGHSHLAEWLEKQGEQKAPLELKGVCNYRT